MSGGLRRRSALTGSSSSSQLARWTQPGFIKLIQRGTITITGATSNTATITAVVPGVTRLIRLGQTDDGANADNSFYVLLTLTNATTVTASVDTSPGGNNLIVSFEVIEYYPGAIKFLSRGTITTAGVASNTATIQPVNTLKTQLDHLGMTSDNAAASQPTPTRLVLTNATTITASPGTSAFGTQITGYQVTEWF